MSKLREDYTGSLAGRIEAFVNGSELCDENSRNEKVIVAADIEDSASESEKLTWDERLGRQRQEDQRTFETRVSDMTDKSLKLFKKLYFVGAVIVALAIMATLIMTVSYMPQFGNPDNPVNNEVPARYIESGMQETGTVNVVTGLILNYRGFDTMGETHVLYIAATTVMILLLVTKKSLLTKEYQQDRSFEPKNDGILQKVATFLIPIIAVFGIYVILNGHISPGGGFSGGSILGAGLILYVSAFGFPKTEKMFNEEVYIVMKVSALCCYVGCLSYYFYMGANGFPNHIPLGTPGAIISSGLILFIDIFVGTEVACTMYAFYALFRRGEI